MPSKTYNLKDDFAPIMKGESNCRTLLNGRATTFVKHLANVTLGGVEGMQWAGWAKLPGDNHKAWARFFLRQGQGGGYTGEGYVIAYSGIDGSRFGHFAICVHQMVEGAGADHRRGWHPGHCGLCGMDMSVDSGD